MKLTGTVIKKMSTSIDGGYVLTIDIPENNRDAAQELFGADRNSSYSVEVIAE